MPQRAIMVIGSFYIKCVTDCGAASAADILILPIVMVEKESENILTGDNKRRTDRQTLSFCYGIIHEAITEASDVRGSERRRCGRLTSFLYAFAEPAGS